MEIIVGKSAGFCYGVNRAVEGATRTIEENTGNIVYGLGEIVHNKQVVSDLKEKGIKFINDINCIKDKNAKLIIRAHGVDKNIYKEAKNKNIEIIDYTCPFVAKIHSIVEEYKKKEYYIFLLGMKEHPEIEGIKSHCGENFSVIENLEDIDIALQDFKETEMKKILVVEQTTYNIDKFEKTLKRIKDKIENKYELVVKNTICLATNERQEETKILSKKVEFMIIIGGKNSSNTRKLFDIAKENCKEAICIENENELEKNNIKANIIGIMAGASTPKKSIDDVVKYLKEKYM